MKKDHSTTGLILLTGFLMLEVGIEKVYGFAYASLACGALLLMYGLIRELREGQQRGIEKRGETRGA